MRTELNLKDNELILYAFIFGFCQDGVGKYEGSLAYIEEWLGIAPKNIRARLKSLIDKGCLIKNEKIVNGVKYCSYQTIIPESIKQGRYETYPLGTKRTGGGYETTSGGRYETYHNNKEYNNKDNNKDIPPIIPLQDDFDLTTDDDYVFTDVEIVDDLDFENVWKMYGEHGNKYLAQCEWKSIPLEDKRKVIQHIPIYNASISELRYKKKLENYLRTKEYNVKPIDHNGQRTTKQSNITNQDIADIINQTFHT